jgi:hypothetical protein
MHVYRIHPVIMMIEPFWGVKPHDYLRIPARRMILMARRRLTILISALTVMSCFLAAQTNTTPKMEQKVFVVYSDKDWLGTGFVLKAGDRVSVRATGRIYFNERQDSVVGPNGLDGDYKTLRPQDFAACQDPLPKENHGCLLAKVNSEVFKLGSSATFSGKEGPLSLSVNDCTLTGKLGNNGVFGVNVKIERDAVAAKK